MLDQLLDAMHRAKKPSALSRLFGHRVSREETGLVSATLGAFYGEAVRARIGGRWELAEFRGERFIALVTGYGKKFAILQKAGKQFECGHQDSVYFFYSFLSRPAERKGKFADLKPRERDRLRAEILERFEALSAERKRKAGKA